MLRYSVRDVYTSVPSGSPGNRLTRLCSQSSRSFACSLCTHSQPPILYLPHRMLYTHIIFILHVNLPPLASQPHSLLLCYLLVLAIVPLVSQCCGGRQHE
jgi:hypothetical protein